MLKAILCPHACVHKASGKKWIIIHYYYIIIIMYRVSNICWSIPTVLPHQKSANSLANFSVVDDLMSSSSYVS